MTNFLANPGPTVRSQENSIVRFRQVKMEWVASLILLAVATTIMLHLGRMAAGRPWRVTTLPALNAQSAYQASLLGLAMFVVATLYCLNFDALRQYLRVGAPSASARDVIWLGIKDESWRTLGPSLLLFASLATAIVIYRQRRQSVADLRRVARFFPAILIIAASNSFSEEVIYRLGVIVPLTGAANTELMLTVSAVAFGLAHLKGMPSGITGAFMAALLGWLLAKSVVETSGLFWAWSIHFAVDVVVFSSLLLHAPPTREGRNAGEP